MVEARMYGQGVSNVTYAEGRDEMRAALSACQTLLVQHNIPIPGVSGVNPLEEK